LIFWAEAERARRRISARVAVEVHFQRSMFSPGPRTR
jgi:hypothetical protein